MNCKKCGASLTENDQFCKSCGASVNAQSVETLGNSTSPNMEFSKPDLMASPNMESSKPDLMANPNMDTGMSNNMNTSTNNGMNNNMNASVNNSMNSNMGYNSMNGNNMNNSQPSWNNGYYSQPNNYNNNKSNNNNTKYIVLGVVVVVALFAVIFVISMVFGKDSGSSSLGAGSNPGITQTSNSTYKVNFKGFTLSIPDNLVYEEQDGTLMIGNEAGTWAAVLELEQGSFAQLKANKSQLQSLMQQSGYTASIASEKTLKGVDFITLEISASGQKAIAALAKANSMYFFGVTAYNQNNEYDYSLLEKVAPILSSAQYNNSTNNIQASTKIDMNGIAGLAK